MHAVTILDTASGVPAPGTFTSVIVNDAQWIAHRFEVTDPLVNVTSVGGFFGERGLVGAYDAFAAIVELSSLSDFPDSFDLSTPDTLATTAFGIADDTFGFVSTPFDVTLASGTYALVFGTGAFGATSIGTSPTSSTTMISLPTDLAPGQFPFSIFTPAHPTLAESFIHQGVTPRFVVEANAVPVSGSLSLLLGGLALSLATARWSRQA